MNTSYQPRVLVDTNNLPRNEWLEWRKQGIGGSDVAAILGISPFRTARDLYYDKLGIAVENDESNWVGMEMGNLLEPLVARIFEKKTGLKVYQRKAMFQHPEHPWMLASVDRLVVGEEAGLECKTASLMMRREWDDNYGRYGIPDGYYCQVQWYMAVTGMPLWYIACLIGGQHFVMKTIPRDDDFISRMVLATNGFWMSVTEDRLPPVDCTADCARNLGFVYTGRKDKAVRITEAPEESIRKLMDIDGKLAELEKEKTLHENLIKEFLKDAEYGCSDGGYYASWKNTKRCYKGTETPIRSFRYGKGEAAV